MQIAIHLGKCIYIYMHTKNHLEIILIQKSIVCKSVIVLFSLPITNHITLAVIQVILDSQW